MRDFAIRLELASQPGVTDQQEDLYIDSPERANKLHLYKELFQISDMSGDSRRFNAKQIAAGQKPLFIKRREKAALYDKLFSEGTATCDELREQAHAISSGKVHKLSQVKGLPEGSVRLGFTPLFDP